MTTEVFDQSYHDMLPSVRVVYPPGCLSNTLDSDWNFAFVHRGTKYLAEHRLYPGKANLFDSLTARDRVYTSHAEMGKQYRLVLSNCPHNGSHGRTKTYYYYSSVLHTGLLVADIDRFTQRKFWADALRRKLGKNRVNLASSIAEYRESAKLFASTAKVLFNFYRDVRHGRWPKFRRVNVSDIPASLLAYNFGIAPLVGDIYSVIEALRLKLTAPVTCRTSTSVKQRLNTSMSLGGNEFNVSGNIRQRATIYYDMDPSQFLSSSFDFGNPIEWVWELIPFSFVLDWFLPVGDFLGKLDALTGISNVRGVVTTKVDERYKGRWGEATNVETPFTGYHRLYQRDIISAVPVTLPSWEPSYSWKKLMNASAILLTMRLNAFPTVKFLR